jgi:hypothetical protein
VVFAGLTFDKGSKVVWEDYLNGKLDSTLIKYTSGSSGKEVELFVGAGCG